MHETMRDQKIALFACKGDLPKLIEKHLKIHTIAHIILAFDGITDRVSWPEKQVSWHKIGHIGEILKTLREEKVTHITLAGSLKRPNLQSLSMDFTGMQWLRRLGMSIFKGDDGLLSALLHLIEKEGFVVIPPHTLLEDITVSPGLLTVEKPSPKDMLDIKMGINLLRALSPFDVGQAVVIREGVVLGIEALEGTQGLLERMRGMRGCAPSGVLIKCAKVGQNLYVDVPTIGPETIEQVQNADLKGIAISAHTTQILNKEKVIALCDEKKLFLDVIQDEKE